MEMKSTKNERRKTVSMFGKLEASIWLSCLTCFANQQILIPPRKANRKTFSLVEYWNVVWIFGKLNRKMLGQFCIFFSSFQTSFLSPAALPSVSTQLERFSSLCQARCLELTQESLTKSWIKSWFQHICIRFPNVNSPFHLHWKSISRPFGDSKASETYWRLVELISTPRDSLSSSAKAHENLGLGQYRD
jgi:hypothetical protein